VHRTFGTAQTNCASPSGKRTSLLNFPAWIAKSATRVAFSKSDEGSSEHPPMLTKAIRSNDFEMPFISVLAPRQVRPSQA